MTPALRIPSPSCFLIQPRERGGAPEPVAATLPAARALTRPPGTLSHAAHGRGMIDARPFSRLWEKVAEGRMRAGAPAPVAATRSASLTFYSYYAYSPGARPAWGPGRDGGLGWGSSGGPAGLGKRTPGSRERNARPRGHYDPRAFGQLAGIHCRFRSALRSDKVPPAAGAVGRFVDQPPFHPRAGQRPRHPLGPLRGNPPGGGRNRLASEPSCPGA